VPDRGAEGVEGVGYAELGELPQRDPGGASAPGRKGSAFKASQNASRCTA